MKKISVMSMVLAVVMSLSLCVGVCFAAEDLSKEMNQVVSETVVLQDISVLETGTYRVRVAEGYDLGYFVIYDKNDEAKDYVIIVDNDYGYIYFNADYTEGYSYDFKGVSVEFVTEEDLGVSSYHVFELVEGDRDYDPVIDGEYVPPVVNLDELSIEELEAILS